MAPAFDGISVPWISPVVADYELKSPFGLDDSERQRPQRVRRGVEEPQLVCF